MQALQSKNQPVGLFYERARPLLDTYFKLILVLGLLHLKPPRQPLVEREIGVPAHTVVDWYSFCREVFTTTLLTIPQNQEGLLRSLKSTRQNLGKDSVWQWLQEQWVFGGIGGRDTGNCFLVPVETTQRRRNSTRYS